MQIKIVAAGIFVAILTFLQLMDFNEIYVQESWTSLVNTSHISNKQLSKSKSTSELDINRTASVSTITPSSLSRTVTSARTNSTTELKTSMTTTTVSTFTVTTQQVCQSPRRFIYLKKHKCASTTIKFVLERFEAFAGIKTLKETMYAMGGCYPGRMTQQCLNGQRLESVRYHFRWNMDEMENILEPGTLRLTSVREPLDQFRSAFNYYYYEHRKKSATQV